MLGKGQREGQRLRRIERMVNQLVANTEALTAAVTKNTEATNAAVAKIAQGVSDQAAVDAATTQIDANSTALEQAVTPPAPPAA
jgi:hypothetical protein